MADKRIVVEIFDHQNINSIPIKKGMWRHAFVRDEDGQVVLAEVISMSGRPPKGGKAWCYAGTDIVDRKQFNKIKQEDPTYYSDKTFEEFMVWALQGCFKIMGIPKQAPKKKEKK